MRERIRETVRSMDRVSLALAAAAAVLLVLGVTGSSRAALTWVSENYTARIGMQDIGVTLEENGKSVSYRNHVDGDNESGSWSEHSGELLENMVEAGEKMQPGKEYTEKLTVRNSGTIDQYVRVVLKRYWEDADGNRRRDLDPTLIRLDLPEGSGWAEDRSASTAERTVLYHTGILKSGQETGALCERISIDPSILEQVQESVDGNILTVSRKYNGVRFVLKAEVHAVQTHNGAEAIRSAWGTDVEVKEDGSIGLKQ